MGLTVEKKEKTMEGDTEEKLYIGRQQVMSFPFSLLFLIFLFFFCHRLEFARSKKEEDEGWSGTVSGRDLKERIGSKEQKHSENTCVKDLLKIST